MSKSHTDKSTAELKTFIGKAYDVNKQHYFMAAAEIVFQVPGAEAPSAIRMNVVVMSKDGRIAVQQLGRAQQAVQLQFRKRFEDPEIQVLDVVFVGLMPLGVFTPEEFNAAPPGTQLQEVASSEVLPN